MTNKTKLKAGAMNINHNRTLKVRTSIKAGGRFINHNRTLKLKTGLKAGALNAYLRLTGETQGDIKG